MGITKHLNLMNYIFIIIQKHQRQKPMINKVFSNKQQHYMPRPKGSPNKVTSEVRSKLQDLLDDLIDSLDLNE